MYKRFIDPNKCTDLVGVYGQASVAMTTRTIGNRYGYDVRDKLGRGTFGVVYKGIDKVMKTNVALKECNPDSDKGKCLVEREVKTMLCIPDHRNIIKFIDHIVDNPSYWIVTELCDLGNLGSYMINYNPKMEEKLLIMKQCVEGVKFLHGLKLPIIHRDLKPENILFKTIEGKTAAVKIADFGLAKVMCDSEQLKTICGTALYMAPELVLEEQTHSFAVDIFSLGLVFLAILLFDVAGVLIPVSASALRKQRVQSVAKEMIEAKMKQKPMPDIAPLTNRDGYQEHCVKKVINDMVVFTPEQRMSLADVIHGISYILPRSQHHPVLLYKQHMDRTPSHRLDGQSVLECMLRGTFTGAEQIEIIQTLVKDIGLNESVSDNDTSALIYDLLDCSYKGDLRKLNKLKSDGANMSLKDYDGRTALHLASVEGHLDCVRYLLEVCHVPHNPKDRWDQTPIDEARRVGHDHIREYIQTHIKNNGKTVFLLLNASKKGDITALQRYKDQDVPMYLSDYDDRTALHLAAAEGHLNCVKFLLETCKVPSCPKDRWEQTPLTEARHFKHRDVITYLEQYLASSNRSRGNKK